MPECGTDQRRGAAGLPLVWVAEGVVDGSKEGSEIEAEASRWVGKGGGFDPAAGGEIEASAGRRVNDPDVADAHLPVVFEAVQIAADAVFGRENFDDGDRRGLNDLFARS